METLALVTGRLFSLFRTLTSKVTQPQVVVVGAAVVDVDVVGAAVDVVVGSVDRSQRPSTRCESVSAPHVMSCQAPW